MNIYVGNLSYEVTDEELKEAFEVFGQVESARVVKDLYSGRSRGFGFVEMPGEAEGQAAIDDLNGSVLKGRTIKVSKARSKSEGQRGGRQQGRRRNFY